MKNAEPKDSFYVQWHILDRCNLRCRHCYQDNFSMKHEPDWPKLRQAADNLLDTMNTWNTKLDVALTGGEPFLKPELPSLLDYLNRSPHVENISIITNGTLRPNDFQYLTEVPKLKELRISLDGTTPETNDLIRGKNSLAKTLASIQYWQSLDIPITLMFTVMKRNRREIPRLIEFGKKLGVHGIIIERFFPLGHGSEIKDDTLDGKEFLAVWQEVLQQAQLSAEPEDLIPYRAIQIRLDDSETDILGSGCVVAKDGMALLPDGTILPCRRFTLPIGNILEAPLHETWANSPILAKLQDKSLLKGKCGTCAVADCIGCRAMCYCLEKDFLAQDPHCFV